MKNLYIRIDDTLYYEIIWLRHFLLCGSLILPGGGGGITWYSYLFIVKYMQILLDIDTKRTGCFKLVVGNRSRSPMDKLVEFLGVQREKSGEQQKGKHPAWLEAGFYKQAPCSLTPLN